MRRRWKWPILRKIAKAEAEDWIAAWYAYLVIGFLVLFAPAVFVDTNANGDMYLGTYLLVDLIVWLVPVAAGVLFVVGLVIRSAIVRYGPDLLPRRVTESVEDIRERYREKDVG